MSLARPLDVLVLGSGPAGLQAALTLARGQRSVGVVEGTVRRNAAAREIHNVLGHDGVHPQVFRQTAWTELDRYGVVRIAGDLDVLTGAPGHFRGSVGSSSYNARRVLLATGMVDVLPPWPGLNQVWGESAFVCPFCHGHELRGRPWALRVTGPEGLKHLALLRAWTDDLAAFTDGWLPGDFERATLEAIGVRLVTGRVSRLITSTPTSRELAAVEVEGEPIAREALVLHPKQEVPPVVARLGVARTEAGHVQVDGSLNTSVPGIKAAGDLVSPMQSAVAALASGQLAAAMFCWEFSAELARSVPEAGG